ncbi:MAG: N-acetylmuramoyl-L-alanine amidase [Desulfobacterales bacterium]|nr:N-acetylmuramoyl-L-alanine amidase [Desulfobacterales bacterium]
MCLFLGLLTLVFLTGVMITGEACAASDAKQAYLNADSAYKRLRNSPSKRQKISEWLHCIQRYESIYKSWPESAWAPAGMYKASELYLKLNELSRDREYQSRALDLAARIKNKYKGSAYAKRAKLLEKKVLGSVIKTRSTPIKPKAKIKPKPKKRQVPTLISPKELKPKDRVQMDRLKKQAGKKKPLFPVPNKKPPTPKNNGKDSIVTGLRFWSNPEYTRIVINGTAAKKYSHGLLRKDPKINKPFQRLYVDIKESRLGKNVAEHTLINDNLLKQARAGQYQPHVVRVVVDIKSFESYKIFSLPDPFRIVIDVWDKGSNGSPPTKQGLKKQSIAKASIPDTGNHPISTDNLKSSDIARQLALGVRKIVIDPGHGGVDPGAPGYIKGVWEKHIVLKLATNLAAQLRKKLNCEVVLTRTTDKKLTLEERTAFANTQRADLFISLHCNAARNKKLKGIETYILNLATDDQAIAVAARENATSEKNISDLEFILSDLMKHAKIEESTRLAHNVQNAMVSGMRKKYKNIHDLGVKQAPFYVLLGARMPAILIEASFLSNKMECKRLMSRKYQDDICRAITTGIAQYINATNPRKL